jgi:hypothetical protein
MKRHSTDGTYLTQLSLLTLLTASTVAALAAEDRRERVLKDRAELADSAHWIYNDLAKGFAAASRTGKPLLAVVRCLP